MPARRIYPCGTEAAYQRHRYYGETPCPACKAAATEAKRNAYRRRNPGAQRRYPLRHGTNACYAAGCRRDICREAHAEYQQEWRGKGGRSHERVTIVDCVLDVLETYWPERIPTAVLVSRIRDLHPEWKVDSIKRVLTRDFADREDVEREDGTWKATYPSWMEAV